MTLERDTDRRLRAWTTEGGIDRAPERFVWAALDDIERVPQRAAWRTRLDGLAVRLRPAAGLAGVAAAVLVAVFVITRVTGPDLRPGAPRDFVIADLPGIVLWQDTKPPDWTLDNLVSNPRHVFEIPIRSLDGAQIATLPDPPGYVTGRYTNFSGPDGAFMSWATTFSTDVHAAAALPFYENEMAAPNAWGLGPGDPITLGDGGHVYTGETTAFLSQPTGVDPIPAQIYLWRHGNALFAIGGFFEFDEDQLRSLAEGMDARAAAAVAKP
jgi:hypothetical protein